ncbi:MAG TPA: hypothetical protein VFT12_09765 [Thermoanaerobaculia bacterium]|nr:hypothetical protein [Thermoanaerobaculia bacterium]
MIGPLIVVAGFSLIGAAAARLLGGGPRFLLGVGTTGFALHVALLLRIPMLPAMIALALGAALVLIFVQRRVDAAEPVPRSALATVITVTPILFLLVAAAIVPLRDYDGRAFWVLKAKAIAAERTIDGQFFQAERGPNPKNEYPLLVPISAAAVMVASGTSDDIAIRWLYVLALGSFALYARRWVGVWPAALIAWLPQFAVAPEGGALSGYNDIFLAAFAAAAFFELVQKRSPLRFGVWLSFLVLTKNEGLPFALLLLVMAVVVWRRQIAAALLPFSAAVVTLFVWRARVEPTDDDPLIRLLPTLPDRMERLLPAATALVEHAFDVKRWGLFWIAVAAAAVMLAVHRRWLTLAPAVVVIGGMSAVYIAAYMVTTWQLEDHVAASADRLIMHLVGPAVYLLGALQREAPSAQRREPVDRS